MSVILEQLLPPTIPVILLTAPHPDSREPAPAAAPIFISSRRVNPFFDMKSQSPLRLLGCRPSTSRGFAGRISDRPSFRTQPVNTLDPASWENPLHPPQVPVDRSVAALHRD